jgi:hypothetical protein
MKNVTVEIIKKNGKRGGICVPAPVNPADFFKGRPDVSAVVIHFPADEEGGAFSLQFDRNQFKATANECIGSVGTNEKGDYECW